MKIQKRIVKHWHSAGTDSWEWVVLDDDNKIIFTAYKKKQAVAFITKGGL